MFYLGRILFILASLFWAASADAQKIRTDQITPSTTLTEHRRFPLSQINDGSTLNSSPYNGFQSNAQRGTITFTLDKPYDVTAFLLWNDVNVRLEGVKSFELAFFDSKGGLLYRLPETLTKTYQSPTGITLGVEDVQRFGFPVVKNTKRIDLIVKSVFTEYPRNPIKRIEIREVEFEGVETVVEEPCQSTRRLSAYLDRVENMTTRIGGELAALQSLELNLSDKLITNFSLPDTESCPEGLSLRAQNLQSRIDALRAHYRHTPPPSDFDAMKSSLLQRLNTHHSNLRRIRSQMDTCVAAANYSALDNQVASAMETVADIETDTAVLRSHLEKYQPDYLQDQGVYDIEQDIQRLTEDISTCSTAVTTSGGAIVSDDHVAMKQFETEIFNPFKNDKFVPGSNPIIEGFGTAPTNIDAQIKNNRIVINSANSLGTYRFSIIILDGSRTYESKVEVRIKKRLPWWVWPLGGGLLVMGGLIAFLLKGRATAAPVEAASTTTRIAGRASESLRRIFRTDLKFRKDEGVPFGKSPLIATAIEPGPEPKLPVGHEIPAGLATLTGPFFVLREAYRATGRIGFAQEGVPTNDDVSLGTGFVIAPNLIMTNQHVYQAYKHYLEGDECGGIEFIAERDRDASDYYEFDGNPPIVLPDLDIAIFRTKKKIIGRKPLNRVYVPTDDLLERDVIVVGYPCPFEVDDYILSLVEPDPVFAIKRVTQGKVFRHSTDSDGPFGILFKVDALINGKEEMSAVCHNATTLAGNSGSPVLCAKTGKLLGVHFAGSRSLFGQEAANLAMAIEAILEKEEEEEF